jgi:hypothetical protein
MKGNFDTLIYLLITIAILVISGLGSRRKRKLQQTQAPPRPADIGEDPGKQDTEPVTRTAFDELRDRFMSELYTPGQMEAKAPRMTEEDFIEVGDQPITGQQPVVASMEEEFPEKPMDEEEEILEEIRKRREETGYESMEKKAGAQPVQVTKDEMPKISGLFEGANELKKAIIYSEILKRKF